MKDMAGRPAPAARERRPEMLAGAAALLYAARCAMCAFIAAGAAALMAKIRRGSPDDQLADAPPRFAMQPMLLGGTALPAAHCSGTSRLRCRRAARVPCASGRQPPASARCGRREALLALGAALLFPRAARADEEPTFAADALAAAPAPAAEAAPPAPPPPQQAGAVRTLSPEERLLLEQNQRIKSLNRAPDDFPAFIRKGAHATSAAAPDWRRHTAWLRAARCCVARRLSR
jgi:hypothetical protein